MYRPPMEDFFRTDPFFSDPFFISPFASPFTSPFVSTFAPPRQQNTQRTASVRIEEVSEDTSDNEAGSDEPIVEQPDSGGSYEYEPRRSSNSHALHTPFQQHDPFAMMQGMMMQGMMMQGMMNGSGFGGFSNMGANGAYFSSSMQSFRSAGDGQTVHYSKTSSTKAGPSGLLEKQETERDSSTGLERISLHRQVGGRARTVTRERKHGSAEVCRESLRGISQDEASKFDQEWAAAAGQHLYPNSSRARRSAPAITSDAPSPLPRINARPEYDSRSRSNTPSNYNQYDTRSHPYTPRANNHAPSVNSRQHDDRYDTRQMRNVHTQHPAHAQPPSHAQHSQPHAYSGYYR